MVKKLTTLILTTSSHHIRLQEADKLFHLAGVQWSINAFLISLSIALTSPFSLYWKAIFSVIRRRELSRRDVVAAAAVIPERAAYNQPDRKKSDSESSLQTEELS